MLYIKGQRILIELNNNCVFEGTYEGGTNDRIDIINVLEWGLRNSFCGPLSFYKSEIISIKRLQSHLSEKDAHNLCKINDIALPQLEFCRLREMTKNYVYLAVIDQKYLRAIDYLCNCESIGIAGFGANLAQMKPIDLLILTSWDQIFIFDLQLYRRINFPTDLKELLESQFIRKVGYDLLELLEFLWYFHKISVKNIFDTQLADLKLQKKEKDSTVILRSLAECLNFYFNFPVSVLSNIENVGLKEYKERPLQDSTKLYVSLLATYLLLLYNKQEKLLLKPYYDIVNEHTKLITE
ncbi:hypothetical protein RI129_012897 [Pyrocoelia pectoralis]|uniref:3'-5' exonuclease domain-containing protein n=1 Tax=Pyrocoelia pectoralis TaxID=417401 RepID=A0AAN7ZCI9_9COLE